MTLAISLLSILAQYGPQAYKAAVDIAHHGDPTQDDFLALHKLVQGALDAASDAVNAAKAP